MIIRTALIVLALAFGLHHAGPAIAIGDAGHHREACAGCDRADPGDLLDAGAAACMAILVMAIGVPALRRALARPLGWAPAARSGPAPAWRTATRGPPGPAPGNIRLCVLRR